VEHPFGYGRDRYFYAFVVSVVLFTLGGAFALYEGAHKVAAPHGVERPFVALAVLGAAVVLEAFSFRTAARESRPLKGEASWWRFIRRTTNPELPVILLEDTGALVGLGFAVFGVVLSLVTGNGVWDGIGTLLIGALLCTIAAILAVEMKSLLIGEGAAPAVVREIERALVGDARVFPRLIHMRTMYLGPEELLVAAKVAVDPALALPQVASAIDAAETRIRAAVPVAGLVYVEPDLDRAPRVAR
jgi:divalent metal cation (Fe/Co/Zn/Cd) transporter